MKRSTERILTTHAGRLPNPDNSAVIQQARAGDQATFDQLVQAGVADLVRQQIALRNDIHSDGEFWKARDEQYYNSRVTGVAMQPLTPGEGPSILVHQQERHMPEFREFYEIYDQIGNIPRPGVVNPRPTHQAVITGPMQYKGQDAIKHELEVVKAGRIGNSNAILSQRPRERIPRRSQRGRAGPVGRASPPPPSHVVASGVRSGISSAYSQSD